MLLLFAPIGSLLPFTEPYPYRLGFSTYEHHILIISFEFKGYIFISQLVMLLHCN